MKRFSWSIVPACITFGPLFLTAALMTRLDPSSFELLWYFVGLLMTMFGLGALYRSVNDQRRVINDLERRFREAARS